MKETIVHIATVVFLTAVLIWGVYDMLHDPEFWESVRFLRWLINAV